ncbi:MAG: HAD family hydrolase [Actinomycetota bacterium]
MTHPLKAVLWDLDGTLVDSEGYWIATESDIAGEHGADWGESDGLAAVGLPLASTAQRLIGRGVRSTVESVIEDMIARMQARVRHEGVPFRPGVVELMADLRAAGVRQGLVTMSYGGYVDAVVAGMPEGSFDVVRTGDTVEHGKPDPRIYLDAVTMLGLDVGNCLAIEDSPSGVGAILAAGVTPVAVPFLVDLPEDDRLVLLKSLAGVGPEHLDLIHRRWQGGAPRAGR